MPNPDNIAKFEKELIDTFKKMLGGKETVIKLRRKDADRNEIVATADKVVDYCIEKNGGLNWHITTEKRCYPAKQTQKQDINLTRD